VNDWDIAEARRAGEQCGRGGGRGGRQDRD